MKKTIILMGLLLAMVHSTFAERRRVFMDFYRKSNPVKNTEVNRAPMRLPIEVVYDSDAHIISIVANGTLEAEVFLYNETGTLENNSSSLNAVFTIATPGYYIIHIQGDGWCADGGIEVEYL